jgi:ABC-type maltose transport system permease subunit
MKKLAFSSINGKTENCSDLSGGWGNLEINMKSKNVYVLWLRNTLIICQKKKSVKVRISTYKAIPLSIICKNKIVEAI